VDLSFSRFEPDCTAIALSGDLAVLLVGIAARQSTSPTALLAARVTIPVLTDQLFAPAHGAFNRAMAATIRSWKQE